MTLFDGPEPWRAFGRDQKFAHAYIGGTFDLIHRGHLALFWRAKRIADRVTVSINTDAFATQYKRKPVIPYADRVAVVGELRSVDQVIQNEGNENSRPAILYAGSKLGVPVDVLIHGDDWIGESYMRQLNVTQAWLTRQQIQIVYLPYTDITSTTAILSVYDQHRNEREHGPGPDVRAD